MLNPGGALATVTTSHVQGGTEGFFVEAQKCYEPWDASTPVGLRLSPANSLACIGALIDGTFAGQVTKRHLFELRVASRRPGV